MNIRKTASDILILIFSAYLCVTTVFVGIYGENCFDVEYTTSIKIYTIVLLLLAFCAFFGLVYFFLRRYIPVQYYLLFISSLILACIAVLNQNLNIYFNVIILSVMFFIILHTVGEDRISLPENKLKTPLALLIILCVSVVYIFVIFTATHLRFKVFASSTFDFGIFAQMFENMAKTGRQLTTLERNTLLSHFEVHFSPIYYIFLPAYLIFRSPAYLLFIQVLFVAAGMVPVFFIAKKFDISTENSLLISFTYLLYPTLTGGLFFDFHENKFLTVIILWLLYFLIHENIALIYVFTILTLSVKEDSFIYAFFIALYLISYGVKNNKRLIKHGIILSILSILYFIGVILFLKSKSQGVMMYRLNIFLASGQNSFGDVIANIIKNPMLLISSLLHEEKLKFLLYMLLPLCFMPLVSKTLDFIFLTIPVIIINLATDYIYQYNIDFQYAYGSSALLFFLAIRHLPALKKDTMKKICTAMVCFSLILFLSNNAGKISRYHYIYDNFTPDFTEAEIMLAKIPDSASVAASTFLTPHLLDHEELYMIDIAKDAISDFDTDYIVIDLRYVDLYAYKHVRENLTAEGYVKVDGGIIADIFEKQEE